jgi:histidinol-phosphate aminotransferase
VSFPKYKWQPTTAEIAAAAGIPTAEVERFDHNTSPTPTPWAADIVARPAMQLNEYPAASYATLRSAIATAAGLEPEQVVPGAGADELILLAARALLRPGQRAALTTPTYPLYAIAAAQAHGSLVSIPAAEPDFAFPADGVIGAAREAELVWLCVPSNPIGNRPADSDIEAVIAATDGTVVIDAAYSEFCSDDWSGWVDRFHNLLVLRTFSKAYGIAGTRVGYALGHPDLISAIDGVRPPGSIGTLSVDVALAALAHPERMLEQVSDIVARRGDLAARLEGLGLRALPTRTNFVLCEVGPTAHALQQTLMAEGLVVRKFAADGPLADYLRFTVRSPSAHDRLIDAMKRSL